MRIGYACLTIGVPDMQYKTCIMKNATPSKLTELIEHNLEVLDRALDYNIENNICMFRISSDIIPFGSSPVNTLPWDTMFSEKLDSIGSKARKHNIRLSMHPGQYTVINSPNQDVVERAVLDLAYHTKFLDSLGMDSSHKLILHIGGIYGDKPAAIKRFHKEYELLDEAVKKRLIIENDDKLYTIEDVLAIGQESNIPVVFDNLHNQINPSNLEKDEILWLRECQSTWEPMRDGQQKMHYSLQAENKKPGSHSQSIELKIFMDFCERLKRDDLDIMLEVKDKNLSAVKCINTICPPTKKIVRLEKEWSRYKYTILEHSPSNYQKIRQLLKDKKAYPAAEFYKLVEESLSIDPEMGHCVNAIQHVWGYFKNVASEKEKSSFQKKLNDFTEGKLSLDALKRILLRLAVKYDQDYLTHSYYFIL